MEAFPLFDPKHKRKNGELSTELKDLDVDRVDGVDRPATGRAFALYKSAMTSDMVAIVATLKKLMPSPEAVVADLIAKACDSCIVKCTDAAGKVVGYVVKGSDVSSPLMPFDQAVALVARAIKGELAEGRRRAGKPMDGEPSIVPTGVAAALDDPNNNASGQSLLDEKKRPDLWEQHLAKGNGLMLDGTRWPRKRA